MIYNISFNDGTLNIKRNSDVIINKNTIKSALETLKKLNDYQYADENELKKINQVATYLVKQYQKALTDESIQPKKQAGFISKTKLPTDFKALKQLSEELKQKKILTPEERIQKLTYDASYEGIRVLPFLKKSQIQDEAVLSKLATSMASVSGWSAVCEKLKEFGFNTKVADNPVLISLAEEIASKDAGAISQFIKEFNIQDQTKLVDIALFAAKQNGKEFSKYVQNFGIEDQKHLGLVAKEVAKDLSGISEFIKNYKTTDGKSLLEQDAYEVALQSIQNQPEEFLANIKNFSIKDTKNLLDIAKKCIKEHSKTLCENIQHFNFGLDREACLLEIAEELIKNGHTDLFSEHSKKFSLSQPHLIQLAHLAVKESINTLASHIQDFNILNADERLKLAQAVAQKDGLVLSDYIKNFQLETTDDKLLKLAETAAENASWKNVLLFIENYGMQSDTLQKLAHKLTVDGEVGAVLANFTLLGINDPKEKEFIVLEAAKAGIDITEKIKKFGIKEDDTLLKIALTFGNKTGEWGKIGSHIKEFGFSDTETGYAKKLELAKYMSKKASGLAAHLPAFEIQSSKDRAEILKSLAQGTMFPLSLELIMQRVSDQNIQNEKQILNEIAEIIVKKSGGLLAKYFKFLAVDKPEDRTRLALAAVKAPKGEEVANYIQDFQIQDAVVLKTLAKALAEKNGRLLAQNIEKFNIKGDTELFLAAVKQAGWKSVAPFLKNFGITDVKERIKLAKQAAQEGPDYFASLVSHFGFQAKLPELSRYRDAPLWVDTLTDIETALAKNQNQFIPSTTNNLAFFVSKAGQVTILSDEASTYWDTLLTKKHVSVDDLEKHSDQLEATAQVFKNFSLADKTIFEKVNPVEKGLLISTLSKAAELIESIPKTDVVWHVLKGQAKNNLPAVIKGQKVYIYRPAQAELIDYFVAKKWIQNDVLLLHYSQMDRILNGFVQNGVDAKKLGQILDQIKLPITFQSILQLGEELSKIPANPNLALEDLISALRAVHHLNPEKMKHLSLLANPERRDLIFNTLKTVGKQIAAPVQKKILQKGTDQELSYRVKKSETGVKVEIGEKEQSARVERLITVMKDLHLIGEMPPEKSQKLSSTLKILSTSQEQIKNLAKLEEKAGKDILLGTLLKIANTRQGGIIKTVKASRTSENLAYKIMKDGSIQIEDQVFSSSIADGLFHSPLLMLDLNILDTNMQTVMKQDQIQKLSLFGVQARREVILNTFLEIGEQVQKQQILFEAAEIVREEEKNRRAFLISDGGVYIKGDVLGQGSYKVVSEGVGLNADKPIVFATIGGAQSHIEDALRESEILQELHEAKIPNLSPAYQVKVLTIDGILKKQVLVLIQEKVGRAEKLLEDMKTGKAPYDLKALLKLAWGGAKGLAGMHKQGYIHADFKTANLLFNLSNGEGLVHDFGLTVKEGKSINGFTPQYSPPNAISLDGEPSFDSFSLGVTLFELLTGSGVLNGKMFNEAVDQNAIDQGIEQEKNKKTDLSPSEKTKFDEAMDLCKNLIQLDASKRLSCQAAAQKLEQLIA